MKILVGIGLLDGVGFYRLIVPYLALRARGYDVEFIDSSNDKRIDSADVLVVSRMHSIPVLEQVRRFQMGGGKVVFDLDDNVHEVPADNPASSIYGTGKPVTRVMEQWIETADVMTVSTPFLAERYQQFRGSAPERRIQVCTNILEDSAFETYAPKVITGEPKRRGEIRIGWAGSDTHRGDFASIVAPLARVMRENAEARLVFLGANMIDLLPQDVRARASFAGDTWQKPPRSTKPQSRYLAVADDFTKRRNSSNIHDADLPTRLWYKKMAAAAFDIALAPLAYNPFNAAKSYIRLLEAGMAGIPIVASDFASYRQYGVQALHMGYPAVRLASNAEEWYEHLTALVTSSQARAALAQANRDNIARDHTVLRAAVQWEDALRILTREAVTA